VHVRKLGVLICATTVPSTARAFMRGQLRYLSDQGWDVRLISSPGAELDSVGSEEGVDTLGIQMERELSPVSDFRALFRWFRELRRIRPDVVSAGTPKAALLAMIASYVLRVPRRVYLVRGLRYEGEHGFRAAILKTVERLTLFLATDIIVVSSSVYSTLCRDRIITKPAFLVGDGSSNGVEARVGLDIGATRQRIRAELGIEESAFVAGFVGRPSADKGSDTLYSASKLLADRVPNFKVLVVGSNVPTGSALNVGSALLGTGWVNNPRDYMCAMDVLVLPTRREGFPNVVLEASTVGIPSITTDATGAIDSVIDGVTGFVVPVDDAKLLSDRLHVLASNPGLRASLGESARRRAEAKFSPSRIWFGLDAIYRGRSIESTDIRVLGRREDQR